MRARPALLLAAACATSPVAAQSVRVRATTTARYVEMRPVQYDSLLRTFVGGDVSRATPISQDFEVSAWGLGVRGLRAYGLFRFRGALGDELLWPRSSDHFDALWGFLELERDRYRFRAGRLQRSSGLGLYAFDGGSALWRPKPTVRLEAWGGWGLVRGSVDVPSATAISSLDPFIPEQGQLLFGLSGWAAPRPGASVAMTWQREILNDFSALVSDRAALDVQWPFGRTMVVTGSGDLDLAAGAVGRARLSALMRLPRAAHVEAAVFRYRPVFPVTTIWGVFSPQAHHGASLSGAVSPAPGIQLNAGWSWRHWAPTTETTPFLPGVSDNAHTFALGGTLSSGDWMTRAQYTLNTGYGGAQSGGEVELAFDRGGAQHAGLYGTAFQQDQQFRVADGTVYGAGLRGRAALSRQFAVRADLSRYWHLDASGQSEPDWSQWRALLVVDLTFGASADRVRAPR